MENNEIENTWRNIDSKISPKSKDELNQLLTLKTRKTMNKFFYILGADITVCVGLIVFLIITALNRQGDIIYQANNTLLCLITLISLLVSLFSWKKLQNNKYNLSLKDWLEQRIKLLSSWLSGRYSRLYIVFIPVLLVMINLSIHVYYEYKPFIEVMRNEESIFGLIIGFVIGLLVSYYAINKIRRYQLKNLEFLKELHGLCDVH
jgi:hypothetical protein